MDAAVITGGCNPLGEVFAEALSEQGYAVLATTRSSDKAADFAERPAFEAAPRAWASTEGSPRGRVERVGPGAPPHRPMLSPFVVRPVSDSSFACPFHPRYRQKDGSIL